LILSWMQKSGVAYSIRDLEKALPSVASINGMQVKDYVQALQDDNKIRVEKIGNGNWYWSFPSEEKRNKENALAKALADRDKAIAIVSEMQMKVNAAGAAREEDEDMLMGEGEDRASLTKKHALLLKEVEDLRQELSLYSENDPAEVEKMRQKTTASKVQAEKWTENILSVESWVRGNLGGDRDQLTSLLRQWYGTEFDEDEGGLKEI